MKKYNRETGRVGEEAALNYLLNKGYQLVARNYATKFGEIDLVMSDGMTLVFVEVKTKKGQEFGRPEEMFGAGKYRKVKNMAVVYLSGKETVSRIDMVAVEMDEGDQILEIRHYENVVF